MNIFGGRTLRQKLAIVLWGTALCAFASSGIALAVYQGLTLERRAHALMEPYADLVSVGTDAAVAFEDPVRAQEILDTLRASPEILGADIVLDDGRVLAHVGTRLDASGRVSTPGVYLGDERVELVRNLQRGAMLHLTMSLGQLRRQTRHTLWLFGAAVVALLAITVGQISVLQRTLVKPIAVLTHAAERVRSRGEYGQRVSASGTDEVARLGRSFNAMMQAIEERENDLRRLLAGQRVLEQTLRESDRRKSEFLAVLSHELRNPLAAICTSIEPWQDRHRHRARAQAGGRAVRHRPARHRWIRGRPQVTRRSGAPVDPHLRPERLRAPRGQGASEGSGVRRAHREAAGP
jgi:HAMP domain-containing protein